MNVPLHQKIELAFWDITIDFLTQSHAMRYMIRKAVELKRNKNFRWYTSIIVTGGLLGFLMGVALPLLAHSIR